MIRIICTKCKNAYLQNKDGNLVCPSCEASFNKETENLLLGVQYYNEENYSEADNFLMKYIVKNGAEPFAITYKALCDARSFDEDTVSLEDTYKKLVDALIDASDEAFPQLVAIANDESEKIEKLLSESHVRLFADADAEKIKKEVEIILNIQNEAKAFRQKLTELVADFNEHSERKISARFSDCFYVENKIAEEVGEIKYQKICDNIASHTVFTGILTNDIKNLEIYYRCIVMFFQKSHDKYEFLLSQAEKFTNLSDLLQQGQYNTIKGVGSVSDKLKSVSYEFLQESYKEHFDEQIDMQTETIVVIEPEIIEEPQVEKIVEVVEEITENESEEISEMTEKNDETDLTETEIETSVTAEDTETEEKSVEDNSNTIIDEDVIEIEINESIKEENEIEDISSTFETEAVAEESIETQAQENTSENEPKEIDVAENAVKESEELPDAVIEVEVEPQYEVIECDVTEETNEEETTVEEVVLENTDANKQPEKVKNKKGHKGLVLVILIILLAGVLAGLKYGPDLINNYKYDKAVELADSGNFEEAVKAFNELGQYSDSQEKSRECEYNHALKLEKEGKYAEAKLAFENLGVYQDALTRAQACAYNEGKEALENKNFKVASQIFMDLGDYGDSKEMVKECSYRNALSLIENKEYKSAIEILTAIKKYSDAKDKILEAKYMFVTDNFDKKNKTTVKYLNELTEENYRNSAELRKELLGSAEVMPDDIKALVNYSATDLETSLTELDNTKVIYFHAVVGDKSLYGKTLTLKYTTAFGYSQRKTVVLSENDNVAVMSYPSTQHKNYTVEFELLDSNGQKIAGQKISF